MSVHIKMAVRSPQKSPSERGLPHILMTASSSPEGALGASRLGRGYAAAVLAAGGLPLMVGNLPPALAEACLDGVAGLLLSGGGDVHPSFFGAEPHPQLGFVDLERDRFELALYRAAAARGLPVLGVCRGVQVMAVAHGGTLHQHLPDLPGALQHAAANPDGSPLHEVRLEPGSRLSQVFRAEKVFTNSYHHQAVDEPGKGLRATGRTSDGVVEALETPSAPWVVGVQWHPELNPDDPMQRALFRAFVDAARKTEVLAPAASG